MKRIIDRHPGNVQATRRRGGFTLIEVLIALAILSLMLLIIFVPVNLGINLFHLGKTNADVQAAATLTVEQMERDLRQAVYVYPNTKLPGVTTLSPYSGNGPYFQSGETMVYDHASPSSSGIKSTICGTLSTLSPSYENLARLDMVLARSTNGVLSNPVQPDYSIVTYYARRLDPAAVYDKFTNPIILYRAQMPYVLADGTSTFNDPYTGYKNLNTSTTRYSTSCGVNSASINRASLWLVQDKYGEPDLEWMSQDAVSGAGTVPGSHTRAIPINMVMLASHAEDSTSPSYIPDSTFTCEDSNSDGKIDRVTIDLMLAQFDAVGADTRNGVANVQKVHYKQTVELPNVR